jgi:hypothetical protein
MVLCVLIGVGKALVQKLEIKFLAMVSWMLLGLCITNTRSSRNGMQHLSNTFKLLNQHSTWAKPTRWMTKI